MRVVFTGAAGFIGSHLCERLLVSGGSPTTLLEAFGHLAAALGGPAPFRQVAADAGKPSSTAADLGRARRELGYVPRAALEEGIARQVAQTGAGELRAGRSTLCARPAASRPGSVRGGAPRDGIAGVRGR